MVGMKPERHFLSSLRDKNKKIPSNLEGIFLWENL